MKIILKNSNLVFATNSVQKLSAQENSKIAGYMQYKIGKISSYESSKIYIQAYKVSAGKKVTIKATRYGTTGSYEIIAFCAGSSVPVTGDSITCVVCPDMSTSGITMETMDDGGNYVVFTDVPDSGKNYYITFNKEYTPTEDGWLLVGTWRGNPEAIADISTVEK